MLQRKEHKETALDRKLREIERERRRVEDELKALSKSVRRGSSHAIAPREAEASAPPVAAPTPVPVAETNSREMAEEGATKPPTRPSAEKKAPVRGDERFAHYFATGGFKTPIPSRRAAPPVERNKAVFLVVVFLLISYIIYVAFIR